MKFKKFIFLCAYFLFFIVLGTGINLILIRFSVNNAVTLGTGLAVVPAILCRPFLTDFLDRHYAPEIPDGIRELHETIAKRYQEKLQLDQEAKSLLGGPYIHSFIRDFEQIVFDFSLYGKAGILTHRTFTRVMTLKIPYDAEKQEEYLCFLNKITLLAGKNKHLTFAGCILAPVKKEISVFLYYEPKYYFSVCKKIRKLFISEKYGAPITETARDRGWETYQKRLLPSPNELWYLLNIRSSAYLEYRGANLSEETEAVIFMTFPVGKRDFLGQAEQYGFSLFSESEYDGKSSFALTKKIRFDTDSLDRMTDFLLHLAYIYGGSFDEYEIFTDDLRKEILENGI